MVWSYQTGGNVYSSPAIMNAVAYFGSYDGNVYAVGEQPGNPAANPPTSNNNAIYNGIGIALAAAIIAVAVIVQRKRRKQTFLR